MGLDMHGQVAGIGAGAMYRTTGTPSPLSPTPSPAGSVGSVGSQSSGYSSGELAPGQPGNIGSGQVGQPGLPQQQQPRPQQLLQQQQLAVSTPNHLLGGPCVSVPLNIHSIMQKQNQYFNYLCTCHEMWEQADNLVQRVQAQGIISTQLFLFRLRFYNYYLFIFTEFFIALDRQCGPLTFHSSLRDVVRYVRAGVQRLRDAYI